MSTNYTEKDVFNTLNSVNVNEHTEKKMNLTYLSWAWAWAEVKKRFPDANYTVYENDQGWNYFTDGRTCWTKVGVTIEGLEHIELLPVMDFRNKSIPLEKVTSMDVNTSIQRNITKAISRHGLALYIYAGEDIPEATEDTDPPKAESKPVSAPQKLPTPPAPVKATAPTPPAPVQETAPTPPQSARVEAPKNNTVKAHKWSTVKSF